MLASASTLVLACLALAAGRVSGKLSGYDFECDDGSPMPSDKYWVQVLCDGVDDCADGSDEAEALCDANMVGNLTVGDKFVARVNFDRIHYYIKLSLCNSSNCTQLLLYELGNGKGLNYAGKEGCNRHGGHCSSSSYHSGAGVVYGVFLTGEHELEVERRADGLSVWLRGFPNRAAWVRAPQDFNTLRVTPLYWFHEMPVTFSRYMDSCNEHEFRCSDGQCLSLMFKCDGVRDCSDGGDEVGCALNSVEVATGSLVLASVQYKAEHGAVLFLLCGDQKCTNVRRNYCVLTKEGYGDWPGYNLMGCDTTSGLYCSGGGVMNECLAEVSFPEGTLEFEVELTDETSVEIRLRGERRYSNWAQMDSGVNRLLVRPANWASDMPVNFTVIRDSTTTPSAPLSTQPAQPVTVPPTTQVWTTASTAGPTQPTTTLTTTTTSSTKPTTASTTTTSSTQPTTASTTTSPWATTPTATVNPTTAPMPTTTSSWSAPTAPTPTASPAWPPRPAPTACESRYPYLLLPSGWDCRDYTVCLGGRGRLARCPAPLLFNYGLQTCSWPGTPGAPDAAGCGSAPQG